MSARADNAAQRTSSRQPSVRRRLMVFLLVPAVALTVAESGLVYGVALHYSSGVRDADLAESVQALGSAMVDSRSDGRLVPTVRRLLEFDLSGRSLFAVNSARHGVVSGDPLLAAAVVRRSGADPVLHQAILHGVAFRIASMAIASPREPGDILELSIAETLHARRRDALQILLLAIPVETMTMALLVASTWWGVRFGLRALDAPTRRLQQAESTLSGHDLAPISGTDIPVEIMPLTRTIDRLFARVRGLMTLQDQFVADAAHQLRTPLAGLSMHVERALARGQPSLQELQHIQALTARLTRTTTQLLSLARAQVPAWPQHATAALDLAQWLPAAVAARVPDALQAGVDLGYDADTRASSLADADAGLLRELLDNLIDNALVHAGRGGTVTIGVLHLDANAARAVGDRARQDNARQDVMLHDGVLHDGLPHDRMATGDARPAAQRPGVGIVVEDSGTGVADALMSRLGERFFRAPDAPEGGSGLGLAIVRRIAEVHGAELRFARAALGGLRVEVRFPALRGGGNAP